MQIQALSFEQLVGNCQRHSSSWSGRGIQYHHERNQKRQRGEAAESSPVNTLESTVEDHTEKLKNDHERITQLEESNRIIMRALMAVMSHEGKRKQHRETPERAWTRFQKFLN